MFNINAIPLIRPIGSTYESKEQKRSGPVPSEELLAISAALKEALEGVSGWIQRYPLMHALRKAITQSPENEDLVVAAKELTRWNAIFRNACSALASYHQQIPDLSDAPIAFEIQKALEQTFAIDIARETGCELGEFGFTSWGALLLAEKEVKWSASLLEHLFETVSSANWRSVRLLIVQIQAILP